MLSAGEVYMISTRNDNAWSIAEHVAKRITSQYNQNVTMIIVGDTGSGKSYAALSLASDVSTIVAEIKGGKPSDYFDVEKNISVINIEKFFDVLDNVQKWNTVILDDAGIGINARKFMDVINITMNNILQTYRTLNLFTILTVPQMFLIDKVSRSLVNYYCEMDGMAAKDVSYGKMFELQKKSRLGSAGKLFYVYPRMNAIKAIGVLFKKPPEYICKAYDPLREQGALEYKTKSIESLKETTNPKAKQATPPLEAKQATKVPKAKKPPSSKDLVIRALDAGITDVATLSKISKAGKRWVNEIKEAYKANKLATVA